MAHHTLDVRYLHCPLPVIHVQRRLKALGPGDTLEVVCTDRAALRDIPTWCRIHGHRVVDTRDHGDVTTIVIAPARH